jgi:hypothetical protein
MLFGCSENSKSKSIKANNMYLGERRLIFGEGSLLPNMGRSGVVGSLRKLEGLMVVVFGRVFYLVGTFSIIMLSWLLVWVIEFGFGMIIGVGMFRLNPSFQCFLLVL